MALGVGALLVVLAAAGLWWFFSGDAPDRVDLETATRGVRTTLADSSQADGGTGSTTNEAADGLDGEWKIDTSTGTFDFKSATGTFAGFRINEVLSGIGSTEAVGRTGDVDGSFTITGTTVTAAKIDVDLSSITTDESMRDRRVQEALATDRYPTATFELSDPIELGADVASGATVEVDATGELTIHGVTRAVTVPLQARLVDGTAVVVGSVDVSFSDYGVKVPSSMRVLSVEDHGTVELQLLLKR
ncbi:MAG: YceI family protein [Microthrixaceae bacterium]